MSSSVSAEGTGWGVFNPYSEEFKKAEKIFHEDFSKSPWHWRQVVVVIASVIGGLFFIVGAFPLFCWTTKWLKPGEDESVDNITRTFENTFSANGSGDGSGEVAEKEQGILQKKAPPLKEDDKEGDGISDIKRQEEGGGEASNANRPISSGIAKNFLDRFSSIFTKSEINREEIPFLWKREIVIDDSTQEKGVLQVPSFPKLWTLEANGQLISKSPESEEQFLNVLQFLEQNPNWVKDEVNTEQIKAYFIQLAKTDFSSSKRIDSILKAYQGIISQYKELFFGLVRAESPILIASLIMGEKEVQIPTNLLSSQSGTYKEALKRFKKDKPVFELSKELFNCVASYFLKGEVVIDSSNVQDLLEYAHRENIFHLQEGCLKFFASTFDVDDPKSFSPIQEFVAYLGLENLLLEEVIRPLCNKNYFGKAKWKKYYGDIGEVPPLPTDILSILASRCPIFKGKKVYETHMLVLVPEKVDDTLLTATSLGELVKNPKPGSGGHKSKYQYFSRYVHDKHKTASFKSQWVLITREAIPKSCGKTYADQQVMLEAFKGKEGKFLYEVPTLRNMAVCLFMHYADSREHLFTESLTRCQEVGTDEESVLCGRFHSYGLFISSSRFKYEKCGMAASRKL